MNKFISNYYEELKKNLFSEELEGQLIEFRDLVLKTRESGNKMMFAGNGASTTIASHGALDFMGQLNLPCISFNDPNCITAFSNDFGYEGVFARYTHFFAEEGDVLVLVSSSGKSPNVLEAAKVAKEKGCKIVTFSGFGEDNDLRQLGDINFWVDSKSYNIVESIHNSWLVSVVDLIISKEQDKVGVHGVEF